MQKGDRVASVSCASLLSAQPLVIIAFIRVRRCSDSDMLRCLINCCIIISSHVSKVIIRVCDSVILFARRIKPKWLKLYNLQTFYTDSPS